MVRQTVEPKFGENWQLKSFNHIFQFLNTANNSWADLSEFGDIGYVHYGTIHTTSSTFLDCSTTDLPRIAHKKVVGIPFIKDGDLIMVDVSEDYSGIGKCLEVRKTSGKRIVAGLHTFLLRGKKDHLADGFKGYLQFIPSVKASMIRLATGISVYGISKNNVKKIEVLLPRVEEQRVIAEVLFNTEKLIEQLGRLITKKKNISLGMVQKLLTGARRLPGFHGEWKGRSIEEIAVPSTERNVKAENLPVLTCSKHIGFLDSLMFFKNQVFSKDTSTYKIIRRGQIGYPSNHVEEGSIGFQNLYDVALVSPIYVVFSVNEGVNGQFLYKVLKQDSYRQKFKTATNSSVDRRGSLRWSAFSQITVRLPPLPEQIAIVKSLYDFDAEIKELEKLRDKYLMIKHGIMQQLLTGRIRLK